MEVNVVRVPRRASGQLACLEVTLSTYCTAWRLRQYGETDQLTLWKVNRLGGFRYSSGWVHIVEDAVPAYVRTMATNVLKRERVRECMRSGAWR